LQEGDFVFGLHQVAVKDTKMCLTDDWLTSFQLDTVNKDGGIDIEKTEEKANQILRGMIRNMFSTFSMLTFQRTLKFAYRLCIR